MDMALTTSCMVKVTATLTVGMVMAKTTYTPNFSHLGLPHGLEQGPVALGLGPGLLRHWEVLVLYQAHLDDGDNVQGPLVHAAAVVMSAGTRILGACTTVYPEL